MALILDDDGFLDAADGFAGWDDALTDDTLAQELEQERAVELESELEQVKNKQRSIEADMAAPDVYADRNKFVKLENEYKSNELKIASLNKEYEDLFEKILEREAQLN